VSLDIFSGPSVLEPEPERPPRQTGVRLLERVPELAGAVPAAHRAAAQAAVVAPVHTFGPGPLPAAATAVAGRPFAWIVLDGIVLRRTWLGDRPAAELLGEGDLIDLRPAEDAWTLPARTDHAVHRAATLAVLDDRFRLAARRWPGLHDGLWAQQAAQTRRSSRQLAAALGHSRVEDRLVALFCDLADRWGRVTPDGIAIDLALTHSLLGELVGSRRPTVSLALGDLAEEGTVVRRADGAWVLVPPEAAAR
jgi:CRP/FNR family transcriptional regulator, cyclic AMP receptor protein